MFMITIASFVKLFESSRFCMWFRFNRNTKITVICNKYLLIHKQVIDRDIISQHYLYVILNNGKYYQKLSDSKEVIGI